MQAIPTLTASVNISSQFLADLAPQKKPTAKLSYHLPQATQKQITVALYINNESTVSFVPHKGIHPD